MKAEIRKKYGGFMTTLHCCEQPLAAYYSDRKPDVYTGPAGGFFPDIQGPGDLLSIAGSVKNLMDEKKKKFRCMFQFLAQTRKKHIPAVFDYDNFGCPGCRYYLGFVKKLPLFNHYFISTGFPVLYKGERFAPTPASSKRHADLLKGIRQKGKYLIFEPLEHMSSDSEPDVVIFFCNAEVLSGLVGLVRFATDEADAVQSPFTSGCASIFSWPVKYSQEGLEKAVLGVFDPAARPYMPLGEMTLSIPFALFKKMLGCYKKSFIYADNIKGGLIKEAIAGWPDVRERAQRMYMGRTGVMGEPV
jgi:uncharacterized protein (DUF169 family)